MKGGGGGGPHNQASNKGDWPTPWLQACIHTWHTCTYTHTHIHTNSHTQCTHINTHAHVCMCKIHVCMCMHTCTHIHRNTVGHSERSALFAIGTTQKSCIAFLTFGQLYILVILNTYSVPILSSCHNCNKYTCRVMLKIYFVAHAWPLEKRSVIYEQVSSVLHDFLVSYLFPSSVERCIWVRRVERFEESSSRTAVCDRTGMPVYTL